MMKTTRGTSKVQQVTLNMDEVFKLVSDQAKASIGYIDPDLDYDKPMVMINGVCTVRFFQRSFNETQMEMPVDKTV